LEDKFVSDKPPNFPRNVLPDLIIPGLALIFAVYYLTTITEVPWIAQASAVLVSGLLLFSIFAFAVRTAYRLNAGTELISWRGLIPDRDLLLKRLTLLCLTIAYVWFLEDLGFTLSTFFFLMLAIMLLSSASHWKKAVAIALAASVIGYIVFIFVFETRFPKGPIERTIEELRDGG
jgi:hypothetical protein